MFRTINCLLIRRCIHLIRLQRENKKILTDISRNLHGATHLCLGTAFCCALMSPTKQLKMDVEDVQKALYEGDVAILQLMEELKDFVKVVSEEYRNCLTKQIEITEKGQSVGPLSPTWDELPQYRTLADELLQQLNNYRALFEMLGQMAEKKFSVSIVQNSNILPNIVEKFKVSREIIQNEFEENKKLETKLLKLNCDTIIMDIVGNIDE